MSGILFRRENKETPVSLRARGFLRSVSISQDYLTFLTFAA
jgi:hypothetical protein